MQKKNLLVLASTYPRWPNDSMRSFVKDYVTNIAPNFKVVRVIVPHYKGAKHSDREDNIRVSRFYYAWPTSRENIAYGEFKKIKNYPIKASLFVASEMWSTFLACLRWRPAIVHAHWIISQGFVAVLLKPILRTKVVVSVHGADVYTLNGKHIRKIKRFVLARADAVIVNSSGTLAATRAIYERDYPLITLGVDTSAFSPVERKPHETLELLFVGRLTEAKGLRYLLEAVTQLQNIHLTVVGDGDLRSELEDFVKQHDLGQTVTFTGGVPHADLARYYAKADIFVGPSIEVASGWQEAFGLVFAEASASGLPIIATDTGGIKDVVRDGVNGLLIPQKDAAAIAQAITKLQKDSKLRGTLAAGGPGVAEEFSWQHVTEKHMAVFRSLAS